MCEIAHWGVFAPGRLKNYHEKVLNSIQISLCFLHFFLFIKLT